MVELIAVNPTNESRNLKLFVSAGDEAILPRNNTKLARDTHIVDG